jgi:PAS domain S-box-containing protein
VSLAQLIAQIDAVRPTPSGYAFYIDSDGAVMHTAAYDTVQAAMQDTSNEEFASTILSMRKGESGVARVTLDGRDVFVGYAPLSDVGGNFALVAPIDEITQQAGAVSSSINSAGNRTIGFTLAMMLAFFTAAILATIWMSRRTLLRPIAALVEGTRAVAAGNEDVTIPVVSSDEFGMLADSFNLMTLQLQYRMGALKDEIQERERTELALREREGQYRSVFESTSDGLIITNMDGLPVDVNPAICEMHGYTRDEFLRLQPTDFIHSGDHHLFAEFMNAARAGEEFRCRARDIRKDGSAFQVDVLGTPLIYEGKRHVLAVVRDITEQVQAEALLEQKVEDRTRELSTLLEVTRNVASTLELDPLLHLIVEQVGDVAGFDRAAFMLLDGDELVVEAVLASPTFHDETLQEELGMRFSVGARILWDLVAAGKPVFIDDVRGDSELRGRTAARRQN